MFICQITGKKSRQGDPRIGELYHVGEVKNEEGIRAPEKLNKIVVQTRARTYKHWDRENEEDWFSYGTEIVKEVNASDEGKAIWEAMSPEQRATFVFVGATHVR